MVDSMAVRPYTVSRCPHLDHGGQLRAQVVRLLGLPRVPPHSTSSNPRNQALNRGGLCGEHR